MSPTCRHRYFGTLASALCGAPANPGSNRCPEHTTCGYTYYGTLGRVVCGEPADPRSMRCAQHNNA